MDLSGAVEDTHRVFSFTFEEFSQLFFLWTACTLVKFVGRRKREILQMSKNKKYNAIAFLFNGLSIKKMWAEDNIFNLK